MENKKDKKDSESIFDFLPGAEQGKVVTRFAPEPSGYLHIGHVKAAMLCFYAAKHFNGKMILRFDDTNPSKEKGEFLESIKEDLKRLEIVPNMVSYSSDHFPKLRELMTELIKKGKAYCDNINPDKMKEDRMNGVKSAKRDTSIEENLKIWKEMQGENPSDEIKKYCIRGKIDYQSANKCLRDPVFYRFTEEKHDRLPENYHLFPCYDFACPCIDSIEGVTHAMRSNEYCDRIPMYEWVQDSLNLRKVNIYEFSRLNMIQTVLSKRYLKWFVETGRVDGWDDPRFPTVQGIVRRGLLPQALKDFCLELGASKKTNLMEWDKIYAINRNYIDPIAKRYFAVSVEGAVNLFIDNMEDKVEEVEVDWHMKNKDLGKRIQKRYNKLVIEKEDANLLKEGQKLTLYRWGNSIVEKIEKEGDKITAVHVKLTPEDKVFKKTTLCHWVPMKEGLYTKAVIREYGHLITVKKLEDNMKIEDIVNNNSKFETVVYIEKIIEEAKKGDKIQLERRGYCVIDSMAEGDKLIQLNFIPDGKTKSQSIIAGKVDAKAVNKGDKDDTEEKTAKKKAEREAKKAKKEEKKKKKEEEQKEKGGAEEIIDKNEEDPQEKGELYYLTKYRNNV
jgi:glutamyl-tRNA synthetase